jgi:quinol monooxygenase YgiN
LLNNYNRCFLNPGSGQRTIGTIVVSLFSNKTAMSLHAQYTHFTSTTGKGKELVQVLMKVNNIVSKADGCRLFAISEEPENNDSIWVTEIWDSAEHQVISRSLDGAKELAVETNHLLIQPPRQITLKTLAVKGVEV